MNKHGLALLLSGVALGIAGCDTVGTDRALFATTTNVGLNIEFQPPASEFGYARRELAISPTFEGGRTPPLLGSFGYKNGTSSGFNQDIHDDFAGGDAAIIMATLLDSRAPFPSALAWNSETPLPPGSYQCIQKAGSPAPTGSAPTDSAPSGHHRLNLPGPGEVAPMTVGTNTSIGLTLGWSGLSAIMPDTVRFGFNHKEMALAPVTATNGCAGITPPPGVELISVRMPSFLATLDGSMEAGAATESGTKISQFFATGDSATRLALQPNVRIPFVQRSIPTKSCKYQDSASGTAITNWIGNDPAKAKSVTDWLKTNANGVNGALFLSCGEYEAQRQAFMKLNNI